MENKVAVQENMEALRLVEEGRAGIHVLRYTGHGFEMVTFEELLGLSFEDLKNSPYVFGVFCEDCQPFFYCEEDTPQMALSALGYKAGTLEDLFLECRNGAEMKGISEADFLKMNLKDYALLKFFPNVEGEHI